MQLPPVIEKMYDLNRWLLPKVAKFPKDKRFILGEKLVVRGLDIQEKLIQAALLPKGDEKSALLHDINLMLEQLRYLVRLATDLKCLNRKSWYYCARNLIEIGRMIGGWIKIARDSDESIAKVGPEPTPACSHPSAGGELKKLKDKSL